MNFILRSTVDRVASEKGLVLSGLASRVIYVAEGRVRVETASAAAALGTNDAWYSQGATEISAAEDALLVRWELWPAGGQIPEEPQSGSGIAEPVALAPGTRYLIRADRVDFPPGGVALLHTHQGPGIRCLIKGSIRIESEGQTFDVKPFGSWFESGPEPVFAAASDSDATSFVRVMLLPLELKGKSSIRYVRPEDYDRPKSQRYQVFLDQPLKLPDSG